MAVNITPDSKKNVTTTPDSRKNVTINTETKKVTVNTQSDNSVANNVSVPSGDTYVNVTPDSNKNVTATTETKQVSVSTQSVNSVSVSSERTTSVVNVTALGPQGIQGPQGIAGPTGSLGPLGPEGPTGAQGIQGIAGPSGSAFFTGGEIRSDTSVTGSFTVSSSNVDFSDTTSITGSVFTGIFQGALSSSEQISSNISGSTNSLSSSLSTRLTTAESELDNTLISSSAQISTDISGSFIEPSSSFSTRITTAETELSNTLISSSAQISTDISGSFTQPSSSISTRLTTAESELSNTLISSSAQISTDISGSFIEPSASISTRLTTTETELSNTLISGSTQITQLGFVSESFSTSGTGIISGSEQLPTGLVSGSAQSVAHITGADLDMGGNKVLFSNVYSTEGDLPSASTYHGMFAHVHATGRGYFAHAGAWHPLVNLSEGVISGSAQISTDISGSFVADSGSFSTRITTAESELNNTLISSSAQISTEISGSFTAPSASISTRLTTAETELSNTLISSSAQIASEISGSFGNQRVGTTDNVNFASVTTSGNVNIGGNLDVSGTTTSIDSATLNIGDKNITIGSGSTTSAQLDEAGIDFGLGGDVSNLRYRHSDTSITSSVDFRAPNFYGTFNGALSSSAQISSDISGSFTAASSSFSTRITTAETELGNTLISSSAQVDHDATTNFVSNEHIDHSGVTLTAGDGLSGGGDITTNRSFAVDSSVLRTTGDNVVTSSAQISTDISGSFTQPSASISTRLTTEESNVDTLQGRTLTAGDGLTGGGTLESDRTFAVDSSVLRNTGDNIISGSTQITGFGFISGSLSGTLSSSAQIAEDISGSFVAPSASISTRLTSAESELSNTLVSSSVQVDHDTTTNFVANEHIDHSAVSISAGGILSGGGNITTNRTITLASSDVVHDSTSGFVANEHIDHTSVTLTAGDGLSGGGDISTNRSFAVDNTVLRTTGDNILSGSAQIATDISGSFIEVSSSLASRISSNETGNITSVTAGNGLTGGGSSGGVTLNVVGGTGIDANSNDIAIDSTVTTLTGTQTLTNKTLTSPTFSGDIDFSDATSPSLTITDSTNTAQLRLTATDTTTDIGSLSAHKVNFRYNNDIRLQLEDTRFMVNAGSDDMDFTVKDASGLQALHIDAGVGDVNIRTLDVSGDADIDGTLETDALTIGGVTSVPFESADHTKLDGIESSATADQTNAEIRTAVEAATDSNVFTDADHSKLNAIEASADVTDTTNVTSAGALMDSELTSITDVKALNQSVVSGATPSFTTTNFTDASNKRLMTDAQETKLDSVESNADVTDTGNVHPILDAKGVISSSNQITGSSFTAGTGLDLSSGEFSVDVSDFMTNGSNNRILTATGTDGQNAEANFTIDGTSLQLGDGKILSLGNSDDLQIHHTTNQNIVELNTGNLTFRDESDNNIMRINKAGGVDILEGNLTVAGNLDIQGTTTTIDSTEVSLGDRILTLNAGSAAGDGGLYVNDASTAETGSLLWDISEDRWIGGLKDSEVNLVTISSTDTLTNKTINASNNTLSNIGNSSLTNSSVNYGGVSVSLGGSDTTPAFDLSDATSLPIVAGTSGTLSVARGGTGATTFTSNTLLTGNGTSAIQSESELTYSAGTLQIYRTSGTAVLEIRSDDSNPRIYFKEGSTTRANLGYSISNNRFELYADGNTPFSIEDGAGSNTLVVDSNSRVGIGTASPTYELDVVGNAGIDGALYHNGDTDTYLLFDTDRIRLVAGGSTKFDSNNTYLTSVDLTSDVTGTLPVANGGTGATTLGANNILTGNGTSAIQAESNLNFYGGLGQAGLVIQGTDPSNTYGATERIRIQRGGSNTDRQFGIYETRNSGGRHQILAFNTHISGSGGAGDWIYTQGSYGGSSHVRFSSGGDVEFYATGSISSGAQDTFTPPQRMIIKNSGFVGIGTDSPSALLDVGDRIHLQSDGVLKWGASANAGNLTWDTGVAIVGSQSGIDLDLRAASGKNILFKVSSSEKMRLDSSGNVGIGETSPEAKLHIKNASAGTFTASNSQLLIENNTTVRLSMVTPTNNASKIEFGDVDDQDAGILEYNNSDNSMRFTTNTSEAMRIDSSQQVGVGTNSPETPLHVNQDSNTHAFKVTGGGGGSSLARFVRDVGVSSPYAEVNIHAGSGDPQITFRDQGNQYFSVGLDDSGNSFNIATGSAVGSSDALTINSTGDVGIGTTNPGYKLSVENELNVFSSGDAANPKIEGHLLRVTNTTNDNGVIEHFFVENDGLAYGMRWVYDGLTNNDFRLYRHNNSTSGTEVIRFSRTSNNIYAPGSVRVDGLGIGIGNTAPQNTLHVNGGSNNVVARFDGTSTFTFVDLYNDGTNRVQIGNADDGDFIIRTSDAERFRVEKTTGDVIIKKHLELPYGEINDAGTDMNIVSTNALTLGTESGTALTFANASLRGVFADDVSIPVAKKLYFGGGDHTYITEDIDDRLRFFTGGAEFMRFTEDTANTISLYQPVNASVQLLVGSATKYYSGTDLQVGDLADGQNGLQITTSTTGYGYVLFGDGTGASAYRGQISYKHGDDYMSFITSASERMRIDATGTKFSENFSSTDDVLHINPANGHNRTMELAGDAINVFLTGGTTSTTLKLQEDGGDVDICNGDLYIDESANAVGIGTISPGAKAHILSSNNNRTLKLEAQDDGAAGSYTVSMLMEGYEGRGNGIFHTDEDFTGEWFVGNPYTANNASWQVGYDASGGQAEYKAQAKLYIDGTNGNIGIANTAPYEKLDVKSASSTSPAIVANGAAANGCVNMVHGYAGQNGDYVNTYGTQYSSGAMVLGYGVKPSTTANDTFLCSADNVSLVRGALVIDNELRFWQGVAANGTLNNNFSMTERFRLTAGGIGHFDGDVVAYSSTVSDKRLKENITTIDNALDKVMELRGVEYDWTATSRKGTHDIGLVAQEVEEVLPELVTEHELCTGEFGGEGNEKAFKTVNYDKMVGVLIEAIKEQQQQINELKIKLEEKSKD